MKNEIYMCCCKPISSVHFDEKTLWDLYICVCVHIMKLYFQIHRFTIENDAHIQ